MNRHNVYRYEQKITWLVQPDLASTRRSVGSEADMEETADPETRTDRTEAEKKMHHMPDGFVMLNLIMGLSQAREPHELHEVAAGTHSKVIDDDGTEQFLARLRDDWLAKGYVEVEQGYWENELKKGGTFTYYPGHD